MVCFITVTVCWVFSVCLHEFGHAVVAYYGGDTTVRAKGYLTLNPVRYTHPVYSLLMPVLFLLLGGIGLPGGAVYINDHLLRSRAWRTAVSLAGPAMNVALVLAIAAVFGLGVLEPSRDSVTAYSLAFLLQLQVSSVLLCLLPIPPLDGFQAIAPWLPDRVRQPLLAQSNAFIWGVFLVLWYVEPVNRVFWTVVFGTSAILGIDPGLGFQGWREYQFWR
jgi:Zn-dependent protease